MTYPTNIRVIRVMCSGRVDPQFIVKAFEEGASGVIVAGCHPGDCHYMEGNYKALRRMTLLRRMLENLGIEKERLRLEWISASEGAKVPKVVQEMVEELKKLPPLKLKVEG
jgi:F420-non-reducing hydrogenase iron-sulfur subunit